METNTMRFILLGNSKTGKTTFFNNLKTYHDDDSGPTFGVDLLTFKHKFYNYDSKIIIWDTSGEERLITIINSYIPNNCGYILFFDLNNISSFNSLEKWIKLIKHLNKCNHDHPIFLIGNKKELIQLVNNDYIADLVEKYQLIYITTSCKYYDSHIIMDAVINEIFVRFIAKSIKCNGIR